jgi:hypothetical protein
MPIFFKAFTLWSLSTFFSLPLWGFYVVLQNTSSPSRLPCARDYSDQLQARIISHWAAYDDGIIVNRLQEFNTCSSSVVSDTSVMNTPSYNTQSCPCEMQSSSFPSLRSPGKKVKNIPLTPEEKERVKQTKKAVQEKQRAQEQEIESKKKEHRKTTNIVIASNNKKQLKRAKPAPDIVDPHILQYQKTIYAKTQKSLKQLKGNPTYLERSEKIQAALQKPLYNFESLTHEFKSPACYEILQECGKNQNCFEKNYLNSLQQIAYHEAIDIIERAADIRQLNNDMPIYSLTHIGAQLGCDAHEQGYKGELVKSFSLLDFGSALLDYSCALANQLELNLGPIRGTVKGVGNVIHNLESVCYYTCHPQQIPDAVMAFDKAAWKLFESFGPPSWSYSLVKSGIEYYQNRSLTFTVEDVSNLSSAAWHDYCQDSVRFYSNWSLAGQKAWQGYKNSSWEDLSEVAFEKITEFYLTGVLCDGLSLVGKAALQEMKELKNVTSLTAIEFMQKAPVCALIGKANQLVAAELTSSSGALKNLASIAKNEIKAAEVITSTAVRTEAILSQNTLKDYLPLPYATYGEELANIWKIITPTQEVYPFTMIPKSFKFQIGNELIWLHPNATKHFYEIIALPMEKNFLRNTFSTFAEQTKLAQELLLDDLKVAIQGAIKNGVPYKQRVNILNWELEFGYPRIEGECPVLFHAQNILFKK